MAQRKPPTKPSKSAPKAAKSVPTRPAAKPPAKRPPTKPGKSIVNQKQTPWALIAGVVVIVLFAGGIIAYAVTQHKSSKSGDSFLSELAAAKAIPGLTFKTEASRDHIASGTVNYDSSPPVGGDHSPYWADCTGTVYADAIANENAVHMLEHGAVWITYKPGLAKADVSTLSKLVSGQDRMAMSPYPGLKTNISLQAWGYQLFVDKASDPRIQQFIDTLRYNPKTTPEYGADCSQPTFKTHPSTFGHPLFAPVSG
jgi:uncharacterized protein DUF3105